MRPPIGAKLEYCIQLRACCAWKIAQLLEETRRALAILEVNTTDHPTSSNAFGSLGEAYCRNREKDLALNSYQKPSSWPTNGHAVSILRDLKSQQ
jgi:hypothetical protein